MKRILPRTPLVLKILKKYWIRYKEVEDEFRHSVAKIETDMRDELKEPTLEFETVTGCNGIKTANGSMKAVDEHTLEKIKMGKNK